MNENKNKKETHSSDSKPKQELRRELGVFAAVMLGLGSILGTGVFVSIGIAADVAGPSVILAIFLASIVAICNGLSSAQLAAIHPVSGGTYEYGYRWLTPRLGFTAGWLFMLAKSASAATAALGLSGYLLHLVGKEQFAIPIALAALALVTIITLIGIRRTSFINVLIVSITLASLLFFVFAGFPKAVTNWNANVPTFFGDLDFTGTGLLKATALMFVAYTGYGRIATLGEEVKEPAKTIPRAVIVTLVVSMLLYVSVAFVGIGAVGAEAFGSATQKQMAPLQMIAETFDIKGGGLILAIGAITAMLGVLLNLVLGLSRVLFAMSRRGDMPTPVSKINPSNGVPTLATIVVALLIGGLVAIGDIRLTWSFSAFTVLIYYSLTNLCVLRLEPSERLYPIWTAWLGLGGCLFLAFWVDWPIWLTGLGLIGVGVVWQSVMQQKQKPK